MSDIIRISAAALTSIMANGRYLLEWKNKRRIWQPVGGAVQLSSTGKERLEKLLPVKWESDDNTPDFRFTIDKKYLRYAESLFLFDRRLRVEGECATFCDIRREMLEELSQESVVLTEEEIKRIPLEYYRYDTEYGISAREGQSSVLTHRFYEIYRSLELPIDISDKLESRAEAGVCYLATKEEILNGKTKDGEPIARHSPVIIQEHYPIFADLHGHTTASDGALSPTEYVEKAASHNARVLAITDHNTAAGVKEAREKAYSINSSGQYLRFFSGVEMDCYVDVCGQTEYIHFIGLNFNEEDASLNAMFSKMAEERVSRAKDIIEIVNLNSVLSKDLRRNPLTIEELQASVPAMALSRPHIGALLVKRSLAKNVRDAVSRFLNTDEILSLGKPAFSVDEASEAIHKASGVCGIAHIFNWREYRKIVLDNMEDIVCRYASITDLLGCFHPTHLIDKDGRFCDSTSRALEVASKYNLFPIGGSDFHGPDKSTLGPFNFFIGSLSIKLRGF